MENKLIRIWKSKGQILEGIKNSIFKLQHIEEIAHERIEICRQCDSYDQNGKSCVVKATAPCCSQCGCGLAMATRSLSKTCPLGKWKSELTFEEEYELQLKLREEAETLPKD